MRCIPCMYACVAANQAAPPQHFNSPLSIFDCNSQAIATVGLRQIIQHCKCSSACRWQLASNVILHADQSSACVVQQSFCNSPMTAMPLLCPTSTPNTHLHLRRYGQTGENNNMHHQTVPATTTCALRSHRNRKIMLSS